MRKVPLSQGLVALVDDGDFECVSGLRWCAMRHNSGRFYAQATKAGRKVLMHRLILDAPPGLDVDHANQDTLDNRRCNIRLATRSQNEQNRKKTHGRSRYKGVWWHKGKWVAGLRQAGRLTYLGRFIEEVDAALAYDLAALQRFGDFARCNFLMRVRVP